MRGKTSSSEELVRPGLVVAPPQRWPELPDQVILLLMGVVLFGLGTALRRDTSDDSRPGQSRSDRAAAESKPMDQQQSLPRRLS
jgi:hypothetical protein